jgi:hypothetical protein
MKKRYSEEQIIKAIKARVAEAKVDKIFRNISTETFYS